MKGTVIKSINHFKFTSELVHQVQAFILARTIYQNAIAVLCPLQKISFVNHPVCVVQSTYAIIQTLANFSLISLYNSSFCVYYLTLAPKGPVIKISLIDSTILIDILAFSMNLTIFKGTLVNISITK